MSSGIYIITNLLDNKVYVGRGVNYKKRLSYHKRKLLRNIHPNAYLQRAYNKDGIENFTFELLEEYEPEFLCSMENWWCNTLNAHNREYGYNLRPTNPFGDIEYSKEMRNKISKSSKGKKWTQERIDSMSESAKLRGAPIKAIEASIKVRMKPVIQLNKFTEEFIEEFASTKEASIILKISEMSITHALAKRAKTAGGFKWEFKSKYNK